MTTKQPPKSDDLYSVKALENILETWKTKAKIAEIKKSPMAFFDKIKMEVGHKTGSFAPFVQHAMVAGIRSWNDEDFAKYTEIAADILRGSGANLDTLRTTFTQFKNIFRKFHDEDSVKFKSLQFTFSLKPTEKKVWTVRSSDALKAKNKNSLIISDEDVHRFVSLVAFDESRNVIDKIITCQVCIGARKIEILRLSKFETVGTDEMNQKGIAKQKKKTDEETLEIDPDREVTKPLIMISQKHFLDDLKDVRAAVEASGDALDATNEKIGKRWGDKLNKRIQLHLDNLGIFKHKEISTSHGLRRLYINYAFKNRKDRAMSLPYFLSTYLGHDPNYLSAAIANYSSITLETASVSTSSQAAQQKSIDNSDDLAKLRKEMKSVSESPQPKEKEENISVELSSNTTAQKFAKITRLVNSGKTSYSDLQNEGISTYLYSKWKKANGLKGEIVSRTKPVMSITKAVADLKKKKKALTYANLREYNFTNLEIKNWKSKQEGL